MSVTCAKLFSVGGTIDENSIFSMFVPSPLLPELPLSGSGMPSGFPHTSNSFGSVSSRSPTVIKKEETKFQFHACVRTLNV